MTAPDRMVTWLRAAMDAAEREAESLLDDLWWAEQADRIEVYNAEGVLVAGADDTVRKLLDGPAAVLRRITADRQLLELHRPELIEAVNADGDQRSGHFCTEDDDPYPCATVRLLAEGYGWTEETT